MQKSYSINELICQYEQALVGNGTIPQKLTERQALWLFRYAIENLLHWEPQEAAQLLSLPVIRKMKLEDLLKCIKWPSELTIAMDPVYIVHRIYPRKIKYDFEKHVLQAYEMILNENKKYPKDFMFGHLGMERARICLIHALKKRTFSSIADIYLFISSPEGMEFLKNSKLYQLYIPFYNTPAEYLHDSLPPWQRNEFMFRYIQFKKAGG